MLTAIFLVASIDPSFSSALVCSAARCGFGRSGSELAFAGRWGLGLGSLGLGFLLLGFMYWRRETLKRLFVNPSMDNKSQGLGWLIIWVILATVLIIIFSVPLEFFRVTFPSWLGAVPMVLLSGAIWIAVITVLFVPRPASLKHRLRSATDDEERRGSEAAKATRAAARSASRGLRYGDPSRLRNRRDEL